MNYPGELNEAVAAALAGQGRGLTVATQALQASYRDGKASEASDLAAYLASRLPATFAANQRVLAELANLLPEWTPRTLLDCGAGPGTASWAAVAQWPALVEVTQVEALPAFRSLCSQLNRGSGIRSLAAAKVLAGDIGQLPMVQADLVVASYVLAELPVQNAATLALSLWARTAGAMVLIEPGTPQGFARIRAAREALRGEAHVVAPCAHAKSCPMAGTDWCHFKVRLARSRVHMQAKQAIVPFEDEAYSYLVVSTEAPSALRAAPPAELRERDSDVLVTLPHPADGGAPRSGEGAARIVSPVTVNKVAAKFRICGESGLQDVQIASRDKPAYKRAKKAAWGDLWSETP